MLTQDDFERVAKGSGLTKGELALLYGVQRRTIHRWLTGGVPQVPTISTRMAVAITRHLLVAISRGRLPMRAVAADLRRTQIEGLRRTLQKLAPAPLN